jgi:hypothetical protein
MDALLKQEAYRLITIREGNRVEKLPLIQAVLRKLGLNALNGNVRSQRTLLEYVTGSESACSNASAELLSAAVQYKENWAATFAECDRRGIDLPNPVPRPNDVIIDQKTGAIRINGPVLTEQLDAQQAAVDNKHMFERSLDIASRALEKDPSNPELIKAHEELTAIVDWVRRGAPYTG